MIDMIPDPKPVSRHIQASAICDHWVARFGLGFHPDTRGTHYVDSDGNQCLSDDEAHDYDTDMDNLFALPVDPYEEGLAAMERAGLWASR